MESAVTQIGWEESSYIWEIRDFIDLREMAKEDCQLLPPMPSLPPSTRRSTTANEDTPMNMKRREILP